MEDFINEEYLQHIAYKTMLEQGISNEIASVILPNLFHRLKMENYDGALIRVLPRDIERAIKIFMQVYSENRELWNNKTNLPLYHCLSTFYRMGTNTNISDRFSGAYSISRLDNRGRIVYLISDDTHSYEGSCVYTEKTIVDFIRESISGSEKFIDLFIEEDINSMQRDDMKNTSYLDDLTETTRPCVPIYSEDTTYVRVMAGNCPLNARIHFADPRLFSSENSSITIDINQLEKNLPHFLRKLSQFISP